MRILNLRVYGFIYIWSFLPLFLHFSPCISLFFLSFWTSNDTYISSFHMFLWVHGLIGFFSSLFILDNFYWSIFKFINSSLCCLHSAIKLILILGSSHELLLLLLFLNEHMSKILLRSLITEGTSKISRPIQRDVMSYVFIWNLQRERLG